MENIDPKVLAFLLSISGILILGFMTVLWFIIQRFLKSVSNMDETLQRLNSLVVKLETQFKVKDESCVLTHQAITLRFSAHSAKIQKMDKEMAVIKSKLNL